MNKESIKKQLGFPEIWKDDYLFKENSKGNLLVGYSRLYRFYKICPKNHPRVSSTLYIKILKSIFIKIWTAIITEIWKFELPYKMGSIYVRDTLTSIGTYKDYTGRNGKYKMSRRYNIHTKGKKFNIHWNKNRSTLKNITMYTFKAARFENKNRYKEVFAGSRGLARWIIKCSSDPTLKDFHAHIN